MFDLGLIGWLFTGGGVIAACAAVAWFFPPFRRVAIIVAAGAAAWLIAYAKGNRDRAELEQKRRDTAVKKAQENYNEIDARPDSDSDVDRRLRDGSF